MKNKKLVLGKVQNELKKYEFILSARVYGSWFYDEKSVDLDIAVMILSHDGIVEPDVYRSLRKCRKNLCSATGCDIDLVPHTVDEIKNINSPLWHPRYNPSLVFGKDIKSTFPVQSTSNRNVSLNFTEIAANVLLDNRTVCRRQLVRSLNKEESRVFVAKLLHGPGNALTYHSYRCNLKYICSPSDLNKCFKKFDQVYKTTTTPAMRFFERCKKQINFEEALKLMLWYEALVALTLYGSKYRQIYQNICLSFKNK